MTTLKEVQAKMEALDWEVYPSLRCINEMLENNADIRPIREVLSMAIHIYGVKRIAVGVVNFGFKRILEWIGM